MAEGVELWETPGHTAQDITTMVSYGKEKIAFSHLWWYREAPFHGPLCTNPDGLHTHRERVLEVATLIVPGHGAPFVPNGFDIPLVNSGVKAGRLVSTNRQDP